MPWFEIWVSALLVSNSSVLGFSTVAFHEAMLSAEASASFPSGLLALCIPAPHVLMACETSIILSIGLGSDGRSCVSMSRAQAYAHGLRLLESLPRHLQGGSHVRPVLEFAVCRDCLKSSFASHFQELRLECSASVRSPQVMCAKKVRDYPWSPGSMARI